MNYLPFKMCFGGLYPVENLLSWSEVCFCVTQTFLSFYPYDEIKIISQSTHLYEKQDWNVNNDTVMHLLSMLFINILQSAQVLQTLPNILIDHLSYFD